MLKVKLSLILAILVCLSNVLISQSGWNPYEIKNRTIHWLDSVRNTTLPDTLQDTLILESGIVNSDQIASESVQASMENQEKVKDGLPENPFEISRIDLEEFEWEPLEQLPVAEREDADLMFVILIVLVMTLGVLIAFYRNIIKQLFKSLQSWNYARLIYRNANATTYFQIGIFNIFFIFSAGIFLYLSLNFLALDHWEKGGLLLFFCIAFVGVLFLLKYLALSLLGWIFELQKDFDHYRFVILVYNVILGLLLLPLSILIAFGPGEYLQYYVYSGFTAISIVLLWRQTGMLFTYIGKLLPFVFHFFLYLCAVEIAPALLIIYYIRMI
jgi:hypothetical protein